MSLPDAERIPLEVVADRWTRLFGELVTVERLLSWSQAKLLHIEVGVRLGLERSMVGEKFPRWISPEERDRFERKYLAPKKAARSDPVRTLMMRYLDKTEGQGDFRGCIEFLLKDPEVDEGENGQILYTSYNLKPKNPKRKTIQNRFNLCRSDWVKKNLNPK